jgi:hypothetical protein
MNHTTPDTTFTERDRERLKEWSEGYDIAFARNKQRITSDDFLDRGAWVAGYVRGLRDRKGHDGTDGEDTPTPI